MPFDPKTKEEIDQSFERIKNRRAAMGLAEHQSLAGDPICGAFFGLLHSIRRDPNVAFMEDFYDVDFEDDSDEIRPY
jgi:hypothetical protein